MTTKRSFIVTALYGTQKRKVEIAIGKTYKVEPLHPFSTKHNGKQCKIVEFIETENGVNQDQAVMEFEDGVRDLVKFVDLVEVK